MNIIRIVVTGSVGAGKTSLIRTISEEDVAIALGILEQATRPPLI
jgi:signal recognition particle receptor subunit beta